MKFSRTIPGQASKAWSKLISRAMLELVMMAMCSAARADKPC